MKNDEFAKSCYDYHRFGVLVSPGTFPAFQLVLGCFHSYRIWFSNLGQFAQLVWFVWAGLKAVNQTLVWTKKTPENVGLGRLSNKPTRFYDKKRWF